MDRFISRLAAVTGGAGLLLANASGVLAQVDYDYTYDTYDTTTTMSDGAAAGLGMGMIAIYCCGGIFGLATFVIWIMSLIHCIQHAPSDQKTLWLLLIIFLWPAAWIYFFTKRKEWGPQGETKTEKSAE